MNKITNQDLLEVREGIIVHQVNSAGKFNGRVSSRIRDKYPKAYKEYQASVDLDPDEGSVCYVRLSKKNDPKLLLAYVFSEEYLSFREQITNYSYLSVGLHRIYHTRLRLNLPVYLPYRLGCDVGGADWEEVQRIIQSSCPSAIICKSN